ncbi:MAG: TRAP transporter large permease subunit [Candidatus Eisenbacteria bacterium]|uniref:TRAP transporter large permease subunit n=1 Tax=Eiseniibacteriota bacterium TaxID=2212470 RepID=A0A956SET7_UNCEI|nr:TRAP transporter large permease subunit [Candidatus Eisenbacteria bacterium]MCB9465149.1 TRAP transporter large permease subunit [Candidatus Eisenbacteria bacterium]
MILLVVLGLLALALLGMPLFTVMGLGSLIAFGSEDISSSAVISEMTRLATSPVLVSIPLFTFAGYLFAEGGTAARLVRLSRAAFGWIPGGLAIVSLVTCAVLTAFTGASGVTIVAAGGLLMPALLQERYSERFSLGLLTTSGSLGLLFPPSLPLILYSYVASSAAGGLLLDPASAPTVDRLFVAGLLPGIFLIVALSFLCVREGGQRKIARTPFHWSEVFPALRGALWEIPLPIIVLGGIYGGKLTVIEAASVTALYAFVSQVFIYRDVSLTRLPKIAAESMTLVGGILVILGAALGLTNYLIDAEVPLQLLEWVRGTIDNRLVFLLVLNAFLLVVGFLMDIFSALIVVVPLIVPLAQEYDVNLVHLGIIFLTNLEIGYSTPPVGLNLFISSYRFGKPVVEVYRASIRWLVVLLIALLVITYVPELSLILLKWMSIP